jgi:3-hydroxyacyl-CoA dehydrogenase/enoyl-CoA hydratase/3-hydroxybutyryl-CoA epimerase
MSETITSAFTTIGLDIEDGIAVVTLDVPNAPVNTLTPTVMEEFKRLFELLSNETAIRGAVLISGKPDIFIAGADIEQFLTLTSAAEAEQLSLDGQLMLGKLERLRVPVVAAIHGACLGGGLETALACAYRIGTEHPKSVLALPDV